MARVKRQRSRKILENRTGKDLHNLTVTSLYNKKEFTKKVVVALNHVRLNADYKDVFGSCNVFMTFSKPLTSAFNLIVRDTPPPTKEIEKALEAVVSNTLTFEALNSDAVIPFDADLEGFREKYWLNGQTFELRRNKKAYFMTIRLVKYSSPS